MLRITIEAFRQAAYADGVELPADIIADGKLRRFFVPQDKSHTKNGWYILHSDQMPAGAYGCWKRGISENWCSQKGLGTQDGKSLSRERMAAFIRQRDEVEEHRHAKCQKRAAVIWGNATEEGTIDHPYTMTKGIRPFGARTNHRGNLIIAIRDHQGNLRGLQFIKPKKDPETGRDKNFLAGTSKKGRFVLIGENYEAADALLFCEGWATGCTLHEASGLPVVVCFDAGNLQAVAEVWRAKRPNQKFIICADDDHLTSGNPGLTHALKAAQAANGCLAAPTFSGNRGQGDTDFNDLHQREGLEAVRRQAAKVSAVPSQISFVAAVTAKASDHEPFSMADLLKKVFRPIQWAIPNLLPEGLAILSGPPKIGKSWMVMDLAIALSSAGYALGYFKTVPGGVLLLSLEDNDRRLQSRLRFRMQNDPNIDLGRFDARTTWKRLDQGGLEALDDWLQRHPDCKLVIIDTIQKIKSKPTAKNANAYEIDYEAYGALQRLALSRQCCILLIHHNRKSSPKNTGDPLEAISGSTGITGTMDTILMLSRTRGGNGAVLTVTGRDIPDMQYRLVFDPVYCSWKVTGEEEDDLGLKDGSNTSLIINVLKARLGEKLSVREVSAALGPEANPDTVKRELYRLARKGMLENDGGKFSRPSSAATVSLVSPVPIIQGHSDTSDMGACTEFGTHHHGTSGQDPFEPENSELWDQDGGKFSRPSSAATVSLVSPVPIMHRRFSLLLLLGSQSR
jgi:putative DNA primase/helicase